GYACPQTVWLEGVYRRIERLIEGSRSIRMRRDAEGPSATTVARKVLKHIAFVVVSFLIAHVFLSYFVSLPALYRMVQGAPTEHWTVFLWATVLTGILYANFGWFREQLCLVVCPYGRLQSVLFDRDSLVIGYDKVRGEPRGKASDPNNGDCVDCKRCVTVCPTGIDIRNGLQLECVACAACVDACDEVMVKLGREPGLVRYDSLSGLAGEARRFLRPRLYLYAVAGLVGLTVATFAFSSRTSFEANLLRLRGAPFSVEGEQVRNAFEVHVVNKANEPREFTVEPVPVAGLAYTVAMPKVTVPALGQQRVPVFVEYARGSSASGSHPSATLRVGPTQAGETPKTVTMPLLGPR
ncbi:MAG: cytochrome c oxidase accessory protein CcoG, partial [Myxococcales bacterium]|nr:cytochrome c oxidase accessory protein CcoG [Myxococcales bacterium]